MPPALIQIKSNQIGLQDLWNEASRRSIFEDGRIMATLNHHARSVGDGNRSVACQMA